MLPLDSVKCVESSLQSSMVIVCSKNYQIVKYLIDLLKNAFYARIDGFRKMAFVSLFLSSANSMIFNQVFVENVFRMLLSLMKLEHVRI